VNFLHDIENYDGNAQGCLSSERVIWYKQYKRTNSCYMPRMSNRDTSSGISCFFPISKEQITRCSRDIPEGLICNYQQQSSKNQLIGDHP
jgi:hypothetical protein